eukprot:TRINITY_DN59311_c0_g1_i2.p1 TRINITY_DN59311_c0_g1~~TRINITY_DN59311_c0_g1_i2.p1  ORF type:complete len:981 (-),score=161.87 TRINITY_DN59311_c0_g1_i2:274-3216(-)
MQFSSAGVRSVNTPAKAKAKDGRRKLHKSTTLGSSARRATLAIPGISSSETLGSGSGSLNSDGEESTASQHASGLCLRDLLEIFADLLEFPAAVPICRDLLDTCLGYEDLASSKLDTDAAILHKAVSSVLEKKAEVQAAMDHEMPNVPSSGVTASKPHEALQKHLMRLLCKRIDRSPIPSKHMALSSVASADSSFQQDDTDAPSGHLVKSFARSKSHSLGSNRSPAAAMTPGGAAGPEPPFEEYCSEGDAMREDVSVDHTEHTIRQLFETTRWLPEEPKHSGLGRTFVLFDDHSKSIMGFFITVLVTLTIAVSTVSFVLESIPGFRERPSECAERLARGLRPTVEACEPVPLPDFFVVETVCIAIFTVDYLARVLTVHASGPAEGVRSCLRRTFRYARQPLNIVDLLAILPFYMKFFIGGGSQLGFVQVLRLARILRIFKLAKHHPGIRLFAQVLVMSGQPLFILVFFNAIIVLLFGSLIYYMEGTRYSVADEFTMPTLDPWNQTLAAKFPTGVYVRTTKGLDGDEVSPFHTIPYSMWWVCVTLTTVGYGDYAPTTMVGKAIGVACFYTGVLFLALPISILGHNFEKVYKKMNKREKRNRTPLVLNLRGQKTFLENTWFPDVPGLRRRIFMVLDDPSSSRWGKLVSLLIMAVITFVTASLILESMPGFNETPQECGAGGRLSVEGCEPRPLPIFQSIETVGIAIFTTDYLLRMVTVHTMPPEDIGIKDPEKYNEESPSFCMSITVAYAMQPMNIVDALAILPFYATAITGADGGSVSVLRVLRLVRVFRIMRVPKLQSGVQLLVMVVTDSLPAFGILIFMTCLMCVFFSAVVTFAEGSTYSVDEDFLDEYPEGLYVRPTVDGYGLEPSPYQSILYAFWWFFATATTVGYGDDVPTTTLGRSVAVVTFYIGIILMALPITIIGGSFSGYYHEWREIVEAGDSWTMSQSLLSGPGGVSKASSLESESTSACDTELKVVPSPS